MGEATATTTQARPGHLMAPGLRARGWTDGLIRRFLPEPCGTRPNFYSRTGPPIRLYLPARVEAVEATAEFRAALAAAAGRKAGAKRAVESKRAALHAHIAAIAVEVPQLEIGELVEAACHHYNRRAADRAERRSWCDEGYRSRPATTASDRAFLDRITVNYVRHALPAYEDELDALFGRVGAREGYVEIKRRVLAAIGAAYPHLVAECERQSAEAGAP